MLYNKQVWCYLQVGASFLNPDYFIETVLKAFHVQHWNMPLEATPLRENIESGQDEAMLEGRSAIGVLYSILIGCRCILQLSYWLQVYFIAFLLAVGVLQSISIGCRCTPKHFNWLQVYFKAFLLAVGVIYSIPVGCR